MNNMNWEQKSAIKHILDERRAEKRLETIGLIITGIFIGLGIALIAHAWIISLTLK